MCARGCGCGCGCGGGGIRAEQGSRRAHRGAACSSANLAARGGRSARSGCAVPLRVWVRRRVSEGSRQPYPDWHRAPNPRGGAASTACGACLLSGTGHRNGDSPRGGSTTPPCRTHGDSGARRDVSRPPALHVCPANKPPKPTPVRRVCRRLGRCGCCFGHDCCTRSVREQRVWFGGVVVVVVGGVVWAQGRRTLIKLYTK